MIQIIKNGYIHTCETGDIEHGYLAFENGKITALGTMADFDAAHYPGAEITDAAGGHIAPGFTGTRTPTPLRPTCGPLTPSIRLTVVSATRCVPVLRRL